MSKVIVILCFLSWVGKLVFILFTMNFSLFKWLRWPQLGQDEMTHRRRLISHRSDRHPSTWLILCIFPKPLARRWIGRRAARSGASAHKAVSPSVLQSWPHCFFLSLYRLHTIYFSFFLILENRIVDLEERESNTLAIFKKIKLSECLTF